jgi:lipopolysaccharide biosynthesis regulator YciM
LLTAHYARQPSIDVLEALNSLQAQGHGAAARQHYLDHLQKHPSLMAAARWLASAPEAEAIPAAVQTALDTATRPLARYRCAACGFEAKEHFWHCPGCQAWDSYPPRRVEEL